MKCQVEINTAFCKRSDQPDSIESPSITDYNQANKLKSSQCHEPRYGRIKS